MINFIEIHSDLGAGKHGTDKGVAQLAKFAKDNYPNARFTTLNIDTHTAKTQGTIHNHLKYGEHLLPFYQKVSDCVENIAKDNTTIFITGDHSGAIGSLSGFKNAYTGKKIAVVWIDAHADLHSVYTTPSGNMHGMPLSAVMGIDNQKSAKHTPTDTEIKLWQGFKALSKTDNLSPQDVYFLGLRSFELPEENLINSHDITAYASDTHRQNFDEILDNLCQNLNQADAVYVSFDIDSLDDSLVFATGTRESNGYQVHEIKRIFDKLLVLPNVKAFEITEFNPTLDDDTNKYQTVYDLFDYAICRLTQPISA